MSGRFFITGLPRSRTAWFAVATNTPTSVCFHEPTARLNSFEDLREFWAPKFGVDIGISDSCLAPLAERIVEELQPRTLVVERPFEDVLRSYINYAARAGISVNEAKIRRFAGAAIEALENIKASPVVKTVQFAALDDYTEVLSAMRWLLPNRDLPDLRTLMTFNIQVAAKHIRAMATKPHNSWHFEAGA